jgi:pimeloyl-ACP methyl ester carboxylesterase
MRAQSAGPVLGLSLVVLIAACDEHFAPVQCAGAEDWSVSTPDGATIFLHHHRAAGTPVLVVHGISSNHWCWDLAPGRSLAQALVDQGFDPWLLDLRGHGGARDQPDGVDGRWTLDDYALLDLPAALDFVREKTGASQVGYVGHSLGGMVGLIYAVRVGDQALSAFVAVGTPVAFHAPDPLLELMEGTFSVSARLLPSLPTPPLAALLSATPGRVPRALESLLYNPKNMDPAAASLMMDHVTSPLWPGEMRHFGRIIGDGRFESADGSMDYEAMLDHLHVPILVVAGKGDHVAVPDRARPLFDRASSREKRYVLASREYGFEQDYGHLDLCLGDRVSTEIFPLVTGWLKAHQP